MGNSRFGQRLLSDADMGISQVKSVRLDIVETVVHVDADLDIASGQIQSLEGSPWTELRRKVCTSFIFREAENPSCAPERIHSHRVLIIQEASELP
jgi:hypothetical protein